MKCNKSRYATICEADGCRQKAEHTVEFGFDPWHCIHLCPACLCRLKDILCAASGKSGCERAKQEKTPQKTPQKTLDARPKKADDKNAPAQAAVKQEKPGGKQPETDSKQPETESAQAAVKQEKPGGKQPETDSKPETDSAQPALNQEKSFSAQGV